MRRTLPWASATSYWAWCDHVEGCRYAIAFSTQVVDCAVHATPSQLWVIGVDMQSAPQSAVYDCCAESSAGYTVSQPAAHLTLPRIWYSSCMTWPPAQLAAYPPIQSGPNPELVLQCYPRPVPAGGMLTHMAADRLSDLSDDRTVLILCYRQKHDFAARRCRQA